MMQKVFVNLLVIYFIGILLFPITGLAHQFGGDNPPEQVHKVIEVLFRLDSGEVHNKVDHDFNNYGDNGHNDPNLRDGYEGGHAGYDVIHIDDDAPFYSLTDGVVIKVKHPNPNNIKELSYIAIYNAYNKTVLYLHPSKIEVQEKQRVEVGTLLGNQGTTGNSSTPHVHLEVRHNQSEVASWGITASKRTNRPNEPPIPFLYERCKHFKNPGFQDVQVEAPVIRPSRNNRPDLVVESVEPMSVTLGPREKFKVVTTLRNQGTGEPESIRLRYYRSTDDRISNNDRELAVFDEDPLAPNDTIRIFADITVRATPGIYYYGMCVDAVNNETNTRNNCSEAIKVIVRSQGVDINNDGRVSVEDLIEVAKWYGKRGNTAADVNGDGVVNIKDLMLVAGAIDDAAAAPALQLQLQALFTAEELQELLTEAQGLENISFSYQKGLALLEELFRLLTPKKTDLLPNYPNPFNPETWIPYQLAESAKVTLTIYAGDGGLIRSLVVGHRPAGIYYSKGRAAYWDGRNELGELVASGVYFYQLETDDFSRLRKMVILK